MTQASPVPDNPHRSAAPPGPAALVVPSAQLVLAAAGFTGYLTQPAGQLPHPAVRHRRRVADRGRGGATYRAEVGGGQLTFRGQWRRSQSVDLTRLVVVRAPTGRSGGRPGGR